MAGVGAFGPCVAPLRLVTEDDLVSSEVMSNLLVDLGVGVMLGQQLAVTSASNRPLSEFSDEAVPGKRHEPRDRCFD